MHQGRPLRACPLFEESQRLDEGLGTQFHLASCYEAVGRLASAYGLFLEVAATARQRGQLEREALARSRGRSLEPRLARLKIVAPEAPLQPLRLERDGIEVGPAQLGVAIPVDPGEHRIRAHTGDSEDWVHVVQVPAEPRTVTVTIPRLEERRDARNAPPHGVSTTAWALAGVGAAFGGSAVLLSARAYSRDAEAERAGCNQRGCPDEDSLEIRRSARTAGRLATWSTALSVASLAGAACVYWRVFGSSPEGAVSASIAPRVDGRRAWLVLSGRF